jgi:hypothetical protein
MASQSSIHFFFNWTKERIDEMDATLASLESRVAEMRSESRAKADQVVADLRKKRDEFESTVKKQAEAGEATWDATMKRLETQWKGFETEGDLEKSLSPSPRESDSVTARGHGRMERASHGAEGLFRC